MSTQKKTRQKVKVVGTLSFAAVMADVKKKREDAIKKIQANGGMCLSCKKEEAELDNPRAVNPFNCRTCNEKTAKLQQLGRMPGFAAFNIS